jgi:hypothetical protein
VLEKIRKFALIAFVAAISIWAVSEPVSRSKRARAVTSAEHAQALQALAASNDALLLIGQGVPRSGYDECNHSLDAFKENLEAKGLAPVDTLKCVGMKGDSDAYVPSFRAKAAAPLMIETSWGSDFSTLSFCQVQLEKLEQAATKRGEVLDSGCASRSVTDGNNVTMELYRPAVAILVKN